jgi:hypothetical protein
MKNNLCSLRLLFVKRFVPAVLFVPIFTEENKGNEDEK